MSLQNRHLKKKTTLGPGKPNDAVLRTCGSEAGSVFVASLQLLTAVPSSQVGGEHFQTRLFVFVQIHSLTWFAEVTMGFAKHYHFFNDVLVPFVKFF